MSRTGRPRTTGSRLDLDEPLASDYALALYVARIFYTYEFQGHFQTFGAIPKTSMTADRQATMTPMSVAFGIEK